MFQGATSEQLQQIIETDHVQCGEASALARIALASLEAEAVCVIDQSNLDYLKSGSDADVWPASRAEMGDVLLYRSAPPAPVSVPDRSMFEKWWESEYGSPLDSWDSLRTTDGYYDDGIDGQFEAWNACRAAMLQGADGNSPVIPDGWVLVPIEPTEDMIVNGFESEPDESFSDEKEWEAYDAMSGCQQAAHRAKLCWEAMISAAPKPTVR
ncbi:Uncharacterised protein [Enterobacter asburiae]|uniref:DUF551 domain-containing protein n=1 Tax=Enterobacter asburiae TaxID=61645 RepID=A0A376F6W2_ENTAS|nr:Uncharacterised protein [Enterobacter asburiae]